MKNKKMLLGSSILLVVLLVIGGTMAWFTAQTEPITNNFKAGTLKIELIDNFEGAPKVNPGDCYEKEVYVKNTGSKRALVRVAIEEEFDLEGLNLDVVEYDLGEGWIEDEDGYIYYEQVLESGGETTPLFANNQVCFDGAKMGNAYQGASYDLTVEADAVQATNGAPTALEWAIDPLAAPVAD